MPLSEVERRMLGIVVDRFMKLNEFTNRKDLATKFKSSGAVDRLIQVAALRLLDIDGNLVPLSLGVECTGDSEALTQAKTSLEITLHVLLNLHDVKPPRARVTFNDVLKQATNMYRDIGPDVIERGLYFVQEFPILESYGSTPTQSRGTKLQNI